MIDDDSNVTNKKVSKPSGKYRKSNAVGCDHPDLEFLESQINTLKSLVATREAELKKVQESDNLKAKKIMNLEAQLSEARKSSCQTNIPDMKNTETSKENLGEPDHSKITNLEIKTTSLESQITLLMTKIENIEVTTGTTNRTVYSCDLCDSEFDTRMNLKSHKEEQHCIQYQCNICTFTSPNPGHLEEHMSTHKKYLTCTNCDYKTEEQSKLTEHKQIQHLKCDKCSYSAIHQNCYALTHVCFFIACQLSFYLEGFSILFSMEQNKYCLS